MAAHRRVLAGRRGRSRGGGRPRRPAATRPRGGRSRRPARGRRRRRGDRARAPRVRPECGRGAARRLEEVDEGRARERGRADRRVPLVRRRTTKPPRSRSSTRCPAPYVVKTDGLAAGKGVIVTESIADARDAVRSYLSGDAFGDAGRTCVIEEALRGPEVSLFVLCDGRDAFPIALAQDHKRAFDGDDGPEHRRHGRVLAGAGIDRAGRSRRRDDGEGDSPDARRVAPPRRRVPRVPVLRADARSGEGPAGARVQRALRRPGVPGGDARGSRAISTCTAARRPRAASRPT